MIQNYLIYKVIAGSNAYGLNKDTSDEDLRGVYCEPPVCRLGLDHTTNYRPEDGDQHYCELTEIIKHMSSGAPNWVEIAFVDPKHVVLTTPWWDFICENRNLLLSKAIPKKAFGFIKAAISRAGKVGTDAIREEERKQIAHAVRMGRTMVELLETNEYHVNREHEREYLLAIRSGNIVLNVAIDECTSLVANMENLMLKSTLPDTCDLDALNEIVAHVYVEYWKHQGWV